MSASVRWMRQTGQPNGQWRSSAAACGSLPAWEEFMPARSRAVATTVAVGVVLAAMCLSFVYVPPWLVRHDAPSHQPAGVGGAADAAKNQATDAGKAIGDARS